jgi:hypothetical protein
MNDYAYGKPLAYGREVCISSKLDCHASHHSSTGIAHLEVQQMVPPDRQTAVVGSLVACCVPKYCAYYRNVAALLAGCAEQAEHSTV